MNECIVESLLKYFKIINYNCSNNYNENNDD